ncbi:MAG: rhodanese-like domain-containing protein [Ignavibacteriaceae bacterium]|nr:rhodanese-like domain-containing protein [Ignavibacteriaceae bacterium]
MKRIKLLKFLIIPVTFLLFIGCEKDKITAPLSVKTETSAKLLLYLEEEGDVINNILIPVLPAEDVYNNLNNYLIIDLRDRNDFSIGHILGAKNILNDSLFTYITTNQTNYSKVVLVSASGQSAAYYSALLRLAGFRNIYYMNFGMASWNILFSSVWTDRLNTDPDGSIFTHTDYKKKNYSPLPAINLKSLDQSLKELVHARVDSLIKEGFNEDYNSNTTKSAMTFIHWSHINELLYTICVGPMMLYSSSPFTTNTYHLVGAILYQIPPGPADFRSVTYLQTLPSADSIAIYSGTGQESAFYSAYLRLLGYKARSILFGMNNIDYYMLLRAPEIIPYAFAPSYIMNYPYSTGPGSK